MKPHKVRFTVWLAPAAMEAAKVRSRQDGVSVSEALGEAATESLLRSRADAEVQIVKAVERVFYLVQRTDRKRGFDQQVLKEMVGLMVLSFFNHTPAVPEMNKKAALLDAKVRFHRFLDTLAANLRGGRSILSDLPVQSEEGQSDAPSRVEKEQSGKPHPANAEAPTPDAPAAKRSRTHTPLHKVHVTPSTPPAPRATDGHAPRTIVPAETIQPDALGTNAPPPDPDPARTKKRWGLFG